MGSSARHSWRTRTLKCALDKFYDMCYLILGKGRHHSRFTPAHSSDIVRGDRTMDLDAYRRAYFIHPRPESRFDFIDVFGATLYFEDFEAATGFYEQVLGPPAYVEGAGTVGWPIGNGWLTLLKGQHGNPRNVELTFVLDTALEAEALQQAFLAAGATGPAPSDQLMFRPVRSCPVVDPFGLEVMIIAPRPADEVVGGD